MRSRPKAEPPSEPQSSKTRGRSVSRKKSIRRRSNHGAILRQPCRYYLKGICTRPLCEYWHPPECQFYKNESGCKAGTSVCSRTTSKKPKKSYHSHKGRESEDKSAVAVVTTVPQLGHMVRKTLTLPNWRPMRISKNPTTVMTANGEWQTREEATVYVRELDLFVTVKLLDDTPAVLSLGKFCEDHGKTYHWTSGQKPQLTKNGKRINCKTANYVPFVVPDLSTSSSTSSSPASSASSSQDSLTGTENPATGRK